MAKMRAEETSSKKEKPKKKSWLRRLLWRALALIIVLAALAVLITPTYLARAALTQILEWQGLAPSPFEVVEASRTTLEIRDLALGGGDFEAKTIHLTYRFPDIFLGQLETLTLVEPTLRGAMAPIDAGGGTRPNFGVVDRYMTVSAPPSGAGLLSQTDVTIQGGQIVLDAGETTTLRACVDAELGADGRTAVKLDITQPSDTEAAFVSSATVRIDPTGMIDAKAELDVTSFALFEWGLKNTHLDLTFRGRPDDGEGVVRIALEEGTVDPHIFRALFAGDENAALRERLSTFSAAGELVLGRDAEGFRASFVKALELISADGSAHLTLANTDQATPALRAPSLDGKRIMSRLRLTQTGPALPIGEIDLNGVFERLENAYQFRGAEALCSAVTSPSLTIGNFVFEEASVDLCPVAEAPLFVFAITNDGMSSVTHRSLWMSEVLTLRYPRNAFSLSGDWPDIDMSVVFDMDTKGWRADFTGQQGDVLLNEGVARLDEFDITGSVDGLGKTIQGVDAQLTHLRVQDILEPIPLYAPMHIDGEMVSKDSIGGFQGQVKDDWGMHLADYKGEQDWSVYKGALSFETGDLPLQIGARQPQNLFPVLKDIMADATGQLEATGEVDWRGAGLTSQGVARITDMNYASLLGPVKGINSIMRFGDLLPLTTKSPQLITVDYMDIGIELLSGEISFSLGSDGQIIIENAMWPWSGGELGIRRTPIALSDEPQDISLFVNDVQLEDVFLMLDVDGLSGKGVLTGDLPATLTPGGVLIEDGHFQSTGDGGVLQYVGPASEAGKQDEGSALMFNALENFEYDALDVTINGNTTDVLEVAIRLEGRNQEVLDGYPMKFNINTEGPLLDMIKRGTVGYRVPGKVQEQFE